MMQTQAPLKASRKLAPPPAHRASDYDWWDAPDDIDDDWHPPGAVNERGWFETFGHKVSDMVLPPAQRQVAPRPGAQH